MLGLHRKKILHLFFVLPELMKMMSKFAFDILVYNHHCYGMCQRFLKIARYFYRGTNFQQVWIIDTVEKWHGFRSHFISQNHWLSTFVSYISSQRFKVSKFEAIWATATSEHFEINYSMISSLYSLIQPSIHSDYFPSHYLPHLQPVLFILIEFFQWIIHWFPINSWFMLIA